MMLEQTDKITPTIGSHSCGGETDIQTKCQGAVCHLDGGGGGGWALGNLHRDICSTDLGAGLWTSCSGLSFHPCEIYNLEGKKIGQ